MTPEYYINRREHVMTYEVFKTLSIHSVGKIIGGLAHEPRKTGKKARKKA